MAANCVTKQQKMSPEYIGAMNELDISSSVLELLLFEYQSLPENEEVFSKGELPFPSIEYLQGQLYAPAITVLDGSIIEYYDKHLNNKTFTAKTLQEAKNIAHVIGKRIGHDSVRVIETKNGQYKVLTTRPKLDNSVEIEKILAKAPRDEQGRLLAPNGKPSNLTERQYAQVRTKAFKEWFGDWESLAEANLNIHDFIRNLNSNETLLKNTTFPNSKIRKSVFHVSKWTVNKFSKDKTNTNAPDTELGYFFAEDLDTITTLREEKHYAGVKDVLGHNVHIVDINLKNPLIVDSYISKLPIKLGYVTEEEFSKFDSTEKHYLYKRIREDVEGKGYDGIRYVLGYELDEDGFLVRSGGYVVFDNNNIKVKSIKNDKSFTNFDAINNIKTLANNTSKVVDENGEPMVVYHGGAKNILEFKSSDKDRSTTGYGYYTEEKTGRKIPIDSNRTVFFSTSWGVAHSYALTYAITQVIDLYNKIDSLIQTTVDGKLAINKKVFNNDIENFFKTLKELSVYNPRYNKFLDYINSIRAKGGKISTTLTTKEVNAFREMLIETRNVLSEDTKHWNIVLSEWEHIYDNAESIEHEYNNDAGIARLQKGEIPKSILKEWALYKKKEANREKEGRSPVGDYEDVHLYLGHSGHLFISLDYDGKDLYLGGVDSNYKPIGGKITELSKEEIQELFAIGRRLREEHLAYLHNDSSTKRLEPRSQTYSVFLNIRNPFKHDYEGTEQGSGYKESKKYPFGYIAARQVDKAIKDGYDGVIYENLYDPYLADNYGVFNPNQIKSATDNIGTFSRESNNIHASRKDATYRQGIQSIEDIFGKELFEPSTTISIQDAVRALEKNKEIAPMVALLKHLQGSHPEITIYRQDKVFDSRGREVDGLYDADNKKIIISNNSTKPIGQVLTHELLHPLLLDKLNANPEIRSELDRIRENAISVLGEESLKYYGLTSVEELISEVLTEGKLIKALDNIKGIKNTKAKGILQQIRDWFNKCLHLIFKKEPSLLDNTLYEIELLISSNSKYTEQSFDIIERRIYSMRGYDASELESRLLEIQKTYPWLFKTNNVNPFIVLGNDGKYKVQSSYKGKYLLNNRNTANKKLRDLHKGEYASTLNISYTDPLGDTIESLLGIDSIMYRDEVEELAHKICIKISDTLTKIQNDPSIVDVITNGRVKGTPEMSRMTRNKLLQTIGVNDIVNYIKELTFGSGNDIIADDMFEMADLLYNNFNTLVSFGMSTFAATEGFSFSLSENTVTVTEDTSSIEDVDEAELSENEGSRQEAWLIESVTKSVIDRMALDVKAELQRCKVLDENGNEVIDRWGLSDNIPLQLATQTILTVTRGSFTLSDMIAKMEKGVKTYPWLQLLLPKLKDKSGQYSSFQSQFYNAMQSHFQLYSVVVNENGKIATKPVNRDTALTEAKRSIVALYNIRQHLLFDSRGAVNKSSLETLKTNLEQLKSKDVEDKLPIVQEVLTILGYDNTDSDFLASIVNDDVVKEISNSLHYIIKGLESHKDDKIITWKPFSADPKDKGIINNISKVIKPFTDVTIDATLSSFHADGKMYQSNKIPSYLTKLFLKFGELSNTVQSATELTPYYKFLQEEYGCTEWFRDNSEDLGVEVNLEMQKGWRLPWLQMLASDPKAREIFAHKVDISFDKKGYMKSSTGKYMNELEYALMALGEYFSETTSENNLADKVPSWFRVPMQSNKPSADFIRFYSYRGQNYKDAIVKDLLEVFNQELSRMQTCTMRKKEIAKDKSIEISSFDKNGTKFCFLDFLEAKRKDTDFGKLVEKKINGEEVNEAELLSQAELLIRESMEQRVAEMLTEFEANGIVKQASKVKGINTSNIKEGIENFLWNDFLASINILELTITDVANYKNAEDLQKRLAQIHAPGNRPNIEATDLEGNKVTDGTYRTIILEDFEGFKSNVVENLRYVFDLELAKLSDDNPNKAAAEATYAKIIKQFEKEVNVTDALGYSCPDSYRKKALMFGRWSKRHEAIYLKLLKEEFTLTDIEEAFGPLKPFVYSNTTRSSYAENAPIKNLKVGVLYKNSEYMLVMADALIRRVSNDRPNLLKAIFDVMKDSYKKDVTKGLDTIQFKSSMKTGISGVLSLNDLVDDSDGYNKAVKRLEDAIYDKNGKDGYNAKHVHASPFEDYCIQQEVPPHFKNHHQAHGSQTRAIIPSDLDSNAKYKVKISDLEYLEYTAQELIEEYESLIYENIKDSYTDLYRELEWNKDNQYTEEGKANLKRHLSEILKRELLSSQRHSLDLFYACILKDGDFRVPLGDAVQSNKVELLINSIIKNRINKQEIAGGPVVQASSFGLSKKLNMVFQDAKGNRLKTFKEYGGTEKLYYKYVKDNQGSFSHMEVYAPIYDERLLEFLDADGTIDIKAIEKLNPELLDLVAYRIPTEDKYSIIPCKIVGFVPREAGEVIIMPEEVTLLTGSDFDIDKMYLMRKEFEIKKKSDEQIIQDMSEKLPQESKELLSNFLKELKEHPYATRRKYPTVWKAYKESAYETSLPKDLRAVRNNKIIDITLSVLSHPSTTALQMTPGGFEEQRKVGYMVEAYKLDKGTWQLLEKKSIDELKDLCYTNKNLNFFDTQMQFYKLNSAAGSILAIFAVAKVAHAIFQTRHIEIDVKKAMGIKQKGRFSIQLGNSKLTPMMRLDATFNDNGQYIGKVLGEMVASSADAVKDPVLNLMNINVETVNVLNSLIRLGVPFKTAAMFLSSKAISNTLNDYYKESLTLNISFTQVVKNKLKELHQENNISWIYEGLTNEELLNAIKGDDPKLDIKVLQMFLGISNLASSVQKTSFITRFNSMSSAVGPLVIDNLITEMRLHDFPLETIYLKKNGELIDLSALSMLNEFPILDAFKQTLTLSNAIFGEDIITNSRGFRRMIASLSDATLKTLMSDRNAFCKLGDFYKSAMLIHSGVFNSEDLKYYIHDFPKDFIVLNFKEKFPENKFIQLLKYNIEKGSERFSLGMELTGMDKRDLGRITAAWLDLYKSNEEGKKLAIDLVKYFFFKGGIGFSPKTPLHLLPVLLRLVIPGYMDAFGKKRVLPKETLVYLQFVQNYWQNNKIAPIKKVELLDEGDDLFSTGDIPMHLERTYFKMKNDEGQFDLYYVVAATQNYASVVKIPKLGNNGEYIEINQLDLAPMESTVSNELEIEDETEIIEVGTTSPQLKEEEPIEVQDDAVSMKEELETLLNDVQKERVSQLKDMSKEEQQSRKNATLAWMKRILKQHGIEVSDLSLEKTFEEYCL